MIERNFERVAAGLFAGAVGYAAYTLLSSSKSGSELLAFVLAAAGAAFLLCSLAMNAAAGGRSRHRVPIFDVREFDEFESDELLLTEPLHDELVLTESDRLGSELVLTEADRLDAPDEPLVLDDILAAVTDDSRVVRLFDRKAMPTPGQLGSSIDHHLERDTRSAHPDAAQALSDALAELRRSLR